MEESVTITLEHYKKQHEFYQDIRKDLVKIIEDKTFTMDSPLEKKIFDLYAKLVSKEM